MQTYRFDWINLSGLTMRTLDLMLGNDVSALEFAAGRCQTNAIDIFQQGRFVAHIKKNNAALDETDRTSL